MIGDRRPRSARLLLAVGALSLLLLNAACSSGSDSQRGGAEPAIGAPPAQRDSSGGDERAGDKGAPGAGGGPVTSVDPAVVARQSERLVRSALLALEVKSIGGAAAAVRSVSAAHGGLVLSENIGSGGGIVPLDDPARVTATTYGEITISVPAERLDQALADLSKVGTVIRRETSSENVNDQYVDTESRVKTMRASVDRVRSLMARATDIAQIVTLEAELSRRQADLEALESQLASLKDRIARSPIRISLTTDTGVIADDAGTGFIAGLKGGWKAFTTSLVVLLTAVGAVLPFAIAGAALGLPLWWAVRRHRGPRTRPAAAE